MARLNSKGEVAGGIAGGIVSANGVTYAQPAGGVAWLDDDTLVYQAYRAEYIATNPSGWLIETTNVRTGVRQAVSSHGANLIVGGGGRWAAWGDGYGVNGAVTLDAGGLGAAARDGTIGVIPVYSTGLGLSLYRADGTRLDGPSNHVCQYGLQVIDETAAIWANAGAIEGLGVASLPLQIGAAWNPRYLSLDGEDWITYWCDEYGQVLHPYTALEGYIVEPTPHTFWPDAVVVDGVMYIAFSWTLGDYPTELVVKTYTGAEARTTFTANPNFVLAAESSRIYAGDTTNKRTGYPPLKHPIADAKLHTVTRPWAMWFSDHDNPSISLTNDVSGSLPLTRLDAQPASTLVGRGSVIAGPPEVIRLGAGLEMRETTLDVTVDVNGVWEPLTNGYVPTPENLFCNGDCIVAWRAS